ncbi:MAG: hypothetical protein DMF88_06985 [Acidobacteria bacterium]|nr:MAG: hypothetical protein DMF88_06985 [Acidobacteriota bacterium]
MFRRSPAPSDAEDFSAEALQFLEPLFATAMRLTRNRADAEDLVHAAPISALGSIQSSTTRGGTGGATRAATPSRWIASRWSWRPRVPAASRPTRPNAS